VAVNLGEGGGLLVGVEAVVADGLADDITVFLFDGNYSARNQREKS
jgi:hypothetical protein